MRNHNHCVPAPLAFLHPDTFPECQLILDQHPKSTSEMGVVHNGHIHFRNAFTSTLPIAHSSKACIAWIDGLDTPCHFALSLCPAVLIPIHLPRLLLKAVNLPDPIQHEGWPLRPAAAVPVPLWTALPHSQMLAVEIPLRVPPRTCCKMQQHIVM